MGLNGSTAGAFVSYTLPMMLHLKVKWKVLKTWQKVYFIYLFFLMTCIQYLLIKVLDFFILIV
jgi:hypothetical protein